MTTAGHDERRVAGNARWVTAASVIVGAFNYVYALLMTRFLGVAAYASFAAGQGLLLWATTVASVSIPWVLAQALARARSVRQRDDAARFAMVVSAVSGLLGASVVGAIAAQFAGTSAAVTLAASVFVIFLGTATIGWLQGQERMRLLSGLYVAENLLKNAAGLLLVIGAGLGDVGALAGFGIGGLLLLAWWPRVPPGAGRSWLTALANRGLWRRALGMAGAQGMVALLTTIDVVLVAVLPASRAQVASYQASAAVTRVPVFVASAVATAFFPVLTRRTGQDSLTSRAIRMYATAALPLLAILVTTPAQVVAWLFPPQYTDMANLLKFTAVAGFACGGISLVTTFFQAADDYACLWWLGGGLTGFTVALLAGWRVAGVTGLAAGGAIATSGILALLIYRLAARQGGRLLTRLPLAAPAAAAALLMIIRPYPMAWLPAAAVVGLIAAARFLRGPVPLAQAGVAAARSHRSKIMRSRSGQPAAMLLADALWRDKTPALRPEELQGTLTLARRNHVEGLLARKYPRQLPEVLAEVRIAGDFFTRNLGQVTARFGEAGIPAVLIKACRPGDCVTNDFDLVVPEQEWEAAGSVLADWYVHRSTYWLERSAKALLYPPVGPALHLHAGVSWFGIPVMPAADLLAHAHQNRYGCLTPSRADELRIWLAHALFQELALPLSGLLAVRELLQPEIVATAHRRAEAEGYGSAFDGAVGAARRTVSRLDSGTAVRLPVPLSPSLSLLAGMEHSNHLYWHGNGALAAREVSLRVPLILAKRRRLALK